MSLRRTWPHTIRWRRTAIGFVLLTAGLAAVAWPPAASAEAPFRLSTQIVDRVNALGDDTTEVESALRRLREDRDLQLWVAYVSTFNGVPADDWARQTAEASDLGLSDVLLAVAVDDRAYAYSVDDEFPLSNSQLAAVASNEVEPQLAESDWAGAAIAAADGLHDAAGPPTSGSGGTSNGDPGGTSGVAKTGGTSVLWVLLALAGLAALGLIAFRAMRRAGRGTSADGAGAAQPNLDELNRTANALLVEVDDAIKTSEQEVAFAAAQFGDEAAAPFAAAVAQAQRDVARAFELKRTLDDDTPDEAAQQRTLLDEIISLARGASDRLDAETQRFDELRDLERNAGTVLNGLQGNLAAVEARVTPTSSVLAKLIATFASTAVESVRDSVHQADERLAFARKEIGEGQAEVAAGSTGLAAVSARAAEDALGQAGQLLDGVHSLASALDEADEKIRSAVVDVQADLSAAVQLSGEQPALAEPVARAEQALADALQAASAEGGHDPLGALRRLQDAGVVLDTALASARAAEEAESRARSALDQALTAARAHIQAAADFITTRRGGVGSEARMRLSEAHRHYETALQAATVDIQQAHNHATSADRLAEHALQLAQQDVAGVGHGPGAGFPIPGGGQGGGGVLGDLITGGILIDSILRGGRRNGSRGGGLGDIFGGGGRGRGGGLGDIFGGGGGGLGPGSFGGIGTRTRRGGGGRF